MAGEESFRAIMRHFPVGVAVVTIDLDGERLGLTIGTLLSLSLEPPLVGISLARAAAMHELLHRAGDFSMSLLASGQEQLAQHFARGVPPIALWQGIDVRPGSVSAAPLLEGALGWLECAVRAEHPTGDHTLFVGEVLASERGAPAPPLLYLDGRYGAA